MLEYKALIDAAGSDGMDSFVQRLSDLRHYAVLLTSVAAGIRDGTIKVPK